MYSLFRHSLTPILFIAPVTAAVHAAPISAIVYEVTTSNPELRFYEAEVDAAKAQLALAAARPNPEVNLEVGRKRLRDETGLLATEGTAWAVSISQTFDWPSRSALRKAIANRDVELAELGLTQFRAALSARVQLLAYRLACAERKARAAAEVSERYTALRELFVAREPAGLTPLLETRVIEAQEIALRRRAAEAAEEAFSARVELNQLRGAPVDTPLNIDVTAWEFATMPSADELLAAAPKNNFHHRTRALELAQSADRVSLARSERLPPITVAPFYSREQAGEKEAVGGLSLSVPLPSGRRTRSEESYAQARKKQAEVALQLAQRELDRGIRTAHQRYQTHTHALAAWAPDAVSRFQEAATLADRHFRLGAVPLNTYIELQIAYLEAVESLLETELDALEAALELQQLTGLPLAPKEKTK
jgi:outer membrane protein, heavy metal efflux system